MRALVIDDSRAIRTILSKMLQGLNFEVFQAENGVDALTILKEEGPMDLTTVDWNMPHMNGYKFLRLVRANSIYKDMPIMMITTETEMEQMMKALEAGANEYVMKPFTKEMIKDKLEILGIIEKAELNAEN